jgi:hypothetical protein
MHLSIFRGKRQSLWQVLPPPTGYGDSSSMLLRFRRQPSADQPERLVKTGLLSDHDLSTAPRFSRKRVDFGPVIEFKKALLKRLLTTSNGSATRFCAMSLRFARRLTAACGLCAVSRVEGCTSWRVLDQWEPRFAHRDPASLMKPVKHAETSRRRKVLPVLLKHGRN